MYGEVIDTVVKVIRGSRELRPLNISVVAISTDETQVVNTPLPCVAVALEESMNADVFIGGLIKDKLNLRLCVMVDLTNFSMTPDGNEQAKLLSLARRVRSAIEKAKQGPLFNKLYCEFGFFPIYQGFKTYQRVGVQKELRKEISVIEIVYQTTMLDKALHAEKNPTCTVEQVDVTGYSGGDSDLTTSIKIKNG